MAVQCEIPAATAFSANAPAEPAAPAEQEELSAAEQHAARILLAPALAVAPPQRLQAQSALPYLYEDEAVAPLSAPAAGAPAPTQLSADADAVDEPETILEEVGEGELTTAAPLLGVDFSIQQTAASLTLITQHGPPAMPVVPLPPLFSEPWESTLTLAQVWADRFHQTSCECF